MDQCSDHHEWGTGEHYTFSPIHLSIYSLAVFAHWHYFHFVLICRISCNAARRWPRTNIVHFLRHNERCCATSGAALGFWVGLRWH